MAVGALAAQCRARFFVQREGAGQHGIRVFSQARGGSGFAWRRAAQVQGRAQQAHRAVFCVGRVGDHPARRDLRRVQCLVHAAHRAGRDAGGAHARKPVRRVFGGKKGFELRDEGGAVQHARPAGGVIGMRAPFRAVQQGAQPGELRIVAHRQCEGAVARCEDLVGNYRGMSVAQALGLVPGGQVARAHVGQHADCAVQQRQVDMLPAAAARAGQQRGKNRLHAIHAGDQVRNGHAQFHRRAVGLAGNGHQAAFRLDHEVVARFGCAWTAASITRDGAIDQAGIDRREILVAQAEGFQGAQPVIFDQHIGLPRQVAHDALTLGMLEVDGDRLLAAVGAKEIGGFAVDIGWRPAAGVIALAWGLDLPDLGAQVGQRLRAPGAGQHAAEVEHADAGQREIVARVRVHADSLSQRATRRYVNASLPWARAAAPMRSCQYDSEPPASRHSRNRRV